MKVGPPADEETRWLPLAAAASPVFSAIDQAGSAISPPLFSSRRRLCLEMCVGVEAVLASQMR